MEKESWRKILAYLIENAGEIYEDLVKIEKIISF